MAKEQVTQEIVLETTQDITKGTAYSKKDYEWLIVNAMNHIRMARKGNGDKQSLAGLYGVFYASVAGAIRSGALCSRETGMDGFPELNLVIDDRNYRCRESAVQSILEDEADALVHPYEDNLQSYIMRPVITIPAMETEITTEPETSAKGRGRKHRDKDNAALYEQIQTLIQQRMIDEARYQKKLVELHTELADAKKQNEELSLRLTETQTESGHQPSTDAVQQYVGITQELQKKLTEMGQKISQKESVILKLQTELQTAKTTETKQADAVKKVENIWKERYDTYQTEQIAAQDALNQELASVTEELNLLKASSAQENNNLRQKLDDTMKASAIAKQVSEQELESLRTQANEQLEKAKQIYAEELQNISRASSKEKEELEATCQKLREELQAKESQIHTYETDYDKKKQELETKTAELSGQVKRLQEELQSEKESGEKERTDHQEVIRRLSDSESALQQAKTQLAEKEAAFQKALESQQTQAANVRRALADQVEQAKAQAEDAAEALKAQNMRMQTKENQMKLESDAALSEQRVKYRQEIDGLQFAITELKKQNAEQEQQHHEQISQLTLQLESAKNELDLQKINAQRELEVLQKENETQRTLFEKEKEANKAASKKEIDTHIAHADDQIKRIQRELDQKTVMINDMTKKKNNLEQQNKSLKKELETALGSPLAEPEKYRYYYDEVLPVLTAGLDLNAAGIVTKLVLSGVGICTIVAAVALLLFV